MIARRFQAIRSRHFFTLVVGAIAAAVFAPMSYGQGAQTREYPPSEYYLAFNIFDDGDFRRRKILPRPLDELAYDHDSPAVRTPKYSVRVEPIQKVNCAFTVTGVDGILALGSGRNGFVSGAAWPP